MIWVTWRQARFELMLGAAVLAAIAAFGVWTGLDALSSYRAAGLPACVASHGSNDSCWSSASDFLNRFSGQISIIGWFNFLPLLFGMLLAAPAVLELESGTHHLAWVQSVTRGRWLAVKIGFGIAISAAISAGTIALWTWWRGPFDALQGRFDAAAFDFEGTVPFAYAVFAFALCLAAGTVLRRSAPAIGVSFVAYLTARLLVQNKLRPHYVTPLKETWAASAVNPAALTKFGGGDWVLNQDLVDSSGHAVTNSNAALSACFNAMRPDGVAKAPVDKSGFNACLEQHGILNSIVYQPASRFWLFQGIETAIFLGLAAVLLLIAIWWVQRRIV